MHTLFYINKIATDQNMGHAISTNKVYTRTPIRDIDGRLSLKSKQTHTQIDLLSGVLLSDREYVWHFPEKPCGRGTFQ